ncbi:GDSL-type esterase/lipase family protein [Carnobacterium jeotgali]|uniref:GDSL-type esterase/lipase family protein n=1 Tax=Carnobacterium jeotgali TaxID=545534 RepID=UPI000690BCF2|nr:GDSL-type esterase/lipase family protein [Carnobacterium jeotgali]
MKGKKILIVSIALNVVLFFITTIFFIKFDVYQKIVSRFDTEEISNAENTNTAQEVNTSEETNTPEKRYFEDGVYPARESLFEVLPIDSDDIVMVGDSLTQRGEWMELTQNTNIKNRGIDSDSVAGVLNRISTIVKGQPKVVYINIGINDLYRGYDIESVLADYKKIINEIKNESPKTGIYIQSLLPVNNTDYNHPMNNEDVQSFNAKIEKIANEEDVTYVNIYSQFANENNELYKEYTKDGVHLSGEGFFKLIDEMSQYIDF